MTEGREVAVGNANPTESRRVPNPGTLRHLLTEARVRAYGDKQLVDKFAEFTRDRIAIGTFVLDPKDKDMSKGYSALREAEGRAAEILAALKNRLSNIEN
jgi:hypothetical protein